MSPQAHERGYILVYTILALVVFILFVTQFTRSTLRELSITDNELAAIIATGAVDAGLECIMYWNDHPTMYAPFNTNTPAENILCESSVDSVGMTTDDSTLAGNCVDHSYAPMTLALPNGSCVTMQVRVEPIGGGVTCKTIASVEGTDSCTNPTTYRTRRSTL